jgi:hypothetical protein
MNLVIGNTSQLSQYFPNDFKKISSRNIDYSIFEQKWNKVFICFAEQRTFITKDDMFNKVNFDYTVNIIEKLNANKIVYYSTAELWNNTSGEIDENLPFNYHSSDYVISKEKISTHIKDNYKNTIVLYPFNFNSIYRMPPFLFGKIFYSIINKEKINIGDTYYYRELLHPSFIVNESINQENHKVIGSGHLIFINSFIRKLYEYFDMKYENYITEDISQKSIYRKNIFYSKNMFHNWEQELFNITVKEINDRITNKIS